MDYIILKNHYDTVLNKDKTTYTSSNDEPTPIGCIEEMMDAVPSSFWKQKSLRILDPCCGNGNFHLVVAERLRLAESQGELIFNDLNEKRLENVKQIFGNVSQTQKDFLTETFDKNHDMVVMNPPYALISANGSRASKNHGISKLFLKKGMDCLKIGGFLVAIVPDNWMSLANRNDTCSLLTQYQFIKLDIHGAKKWFPKIGSSFTWFVIQKIPFDKSFEVSYSIKNVAITGQVASMHRQFIPLCYSTIIQSIFAKTIESKNQKYKIETSSDLHRFTKKDCIQDYQSTHFPYKLIHTPKQTVWGNRPHRFQNGWKVFISTTDKYKTFVDSCGMTQSIAFIRTETEQEANELKTILDEPIYRFLNNVCRYGNFNNIRILQKFPVKDTFDLNPEDIAFLSRFHNQEI